MSQPARFFVLLVYVILLFAANYMAFDQVLPVANEKGIWFFSGVISLLLGKLLTSPYFTKPADSISYACLAFFALVFVDIEFETKLEAVIYWGLIGYYWIVIIAGSGSIVLKDHETDRGQKVSKTLYQLSELLGNQIAIFSSVALYSIWVFHTTMDEQFYPVVGWAITAIQPHKSIFLFWERLRSIWDIRTFERSVGWISSHQTPNILTVTQDEQKPVEFGEILAVKDRFSKKGIAISLNYIGRSEGVHFQALHINNIEELKFSSWKSVFDLPYNHVAKVPVNSDTEPAIEEVKLKFRVADLIGLVMPDSSVQKLYFEVVGDSELEVGQVIQVKVGKSVVLYQLINGLTKEEIVHQKNKYGFARGEARLIGIWKEEEKKFSNSKWIPTANEVVHLEQSVETEMTQGRIGHFPKSKYNIELKDIHSLVTHNTAILGILGIGKSMLAMELVERICSEGIKCICIDLTDQYLTELGEFVDIEKSDQLIADLNEIGKSGKTKVSKNVEEGGAVSEFKDLIKSFIGEFVSETREDKLVVINPSEFELWRQDSKPYNNEASMVSLTPCEITAIISESALEIQREIGMTDSARLCLVYEEAHSLIPEFSSLVNDGDKAATNATARAILQGRKYGMGCLLITQRTANVTKTILNQCNTIFAMRTFDDTGKTFLSNYIGSDYSDVLPNLSEREAVFFGKASSCENPVMLRLNDREDFKRAFNQTPD